MKELLQVIGWTLFPGAAAIGAVVLFNRYLGAPPKPAPREPSDKEPASPVPATSRRRWPTLRLHVLRTPAAPAFEGATEAYAPELVEVTRRDALIDAIAEAAGVDALDTDLRHILEDSADLHLALIEDVEHFRDRMAGLYAWLDQWEPDWRHVPVADVADFDELRELVKS